MAEIIDFAAARKDKAEQDESARICNTQWAVHPFGILQMAYDLRPGEVLVVSNDDNMINVFSKKKGLFI